MSNPYTARACELTRWREGENKAGLQFPLPPMPYAIEEAQVNATLALAYEQRTANLIALLAARAQHFEDVGYDYEALADELQERMNP